MIRPAALYYGQKYRERCAQEARDTTCRKGMAVKLSAQGLRPGVRRYIDMNAPSKEVKLEFSEHTRALVLQAWTDNQLLLLHLDTFRKFLSRPRNWEPADEER